MQRPRRRSLLMHFSLQEMESRCNSNNVSLNITISSVRFLGWGWMAMVVAINFFLRLGWIMAMVVANFLLRQECMKFLQHQYQACCHRRRIPQLSIWCWWVWCHSHCSFEYSGYYSGSFGRRDPIRNRGSS